MKLLHIANARLPTEKAHGLQIMKSCEAFACLVDVMLVHPSRRQANPMLDAVSVWDYYNILQSFPMIKLATPNLLWSFLSPQQQLPFFVVQSFIFAIQAVRFVRRQAFDLVYTRDQYTALLLSFFTSVPYVYEAHDLFETALGGAWQKRCCKKAQRVITNTEYLRQQFIEKLAISSANVLTARNGVDLVAVGSFRGDVERVRRSLDIPEGARIVVYTGHLFPWKGVYVLVQSMTALPDRYHLVLVGGMPADVEQMREHALSRGLTNIHIIGHVPPAQLDQYRQLADVLVVPNLPDRYSTYFACPIKVFEYMAAKRPIVASDLPSIREVLQDGEDAVLVPPNDPIALAEGLRRVAEDRALSAYLVERAAKKVHQYTWEQRAKRVLAFIFPDNNFR